MAWTAPRDWAAISGGIVTAASLNTDVRDNLGVLSTHAHTGAAGMGAATMSGLTLTALVNLTFADEGAPTSAGELQRHGNDLKFYGSSAVNLTAADASAGTASLRSLSTSSTTAAAGNHTHTLSQEYASVSARTTVTVLGNNVEHEVITVSREAADASNAFIVAGYFEGQNVASYPMVFKIYQFETQLATVTANVDNQAFYLQVFYLPGTTSIRHFKVTAQRDRDGYSTNATCVLGVIEVTF